MVEPSAVERCSLGGGVAVLVSRLMEEAGFLVAWTERTGGHSNGRFASLNLGLVSGDDREKVVANRERICAALGVPEFACGQQVHRTTLHEVEPDDAGRGFRDPIGAFPMTDALTTVARGVPLAILTADCVPLALGDPAMGRLTLVHAGWRGLADGILQRSVALFDRPSSLLAAIGPAVCWEHYEVGEEVAAAVEAGTGSASVVRERRRRGVRPRLDLMATVVGALREVGVRSIDCAGTCTAAEPDRFYSYRRDGKTGLQAMVGMRLP